jgi:hypothetical protein
MPEFVTEGNVVGLFVTVPPGNVTVKPAKLPECPE